MFVHRVDPVITEIGGVYLWYYGLSYTIGFLAVFLWFRQVRAKLGLSSWDTFAVSIMIMAGILVFGRLVEVLFYEWDFYGKRPAYIVAYWLGGMATHGILLGTALAVLVFCWWRKISFLRVADELVIPGALIMGLGRLGNFADGLIVGSQTSMWWGVVFPDAAGARHPVVLYDGIKNLALIPVLLWIRSRPFRPGATTAAFLLGYGFLRIFIDFFREYPVQAFGLPPGQWFNITMTILAIVIFVWSQYLSKPASTQGAAQASVRTATPVQAIALAFLLLFPLVMPSDWTQDVPTRYGKRHAGMTHSAIYPELPERKPK